MNQDIKEEIEQLKNTLTLQYNNKEYQAVIDSVKRLLSIEVMDCEAMCKAADSYVELGAYEEALAFTENMLRINCDYIDGHLVLAKIYYLRLEYDKALHVLQNLLVQYKNELTSIVKSFVYNSLANIYNEIGDTVNGSQKFLDASNVSDDFNFKITEYSRYLLALHYNNTKSDEEIFAEHAKYDEFFENIQPFIHEKKSNKEKINIGYISADFRLHVVVFFCYKLLSKHNKNRYNVICYAKNSEDHVTQQLKGMVSGWRDISNMSCVDAAKMIYHDGIDILVDLGGHSGDNCLQILARKPAPIQVSGIGYFNTTGLKTVDYFLTDKYCAPVGKNDDLFVEKLVRLPHSHLCYTVSNEATLCTAAPVNKNGFITFGTFNNFSKVTDEMLLLWKEILDKVPGSKLLLKGKVFGSSYAERVIKNRFINLGFKSESLEFRPATGDYLDQYKDMDIALDTFPYPGGGTTCDALYMGVPVITLVGKRHGARFGYSILKNIGLDDCIAFNETEYIEKAVALAHDRKLLDDLHKTLRQRITDSPVMNGVQYVADVEKCYEEMWAKLVRENNEIIPKKVLSAKTIDKINHLKMQLLDIWGKSQNQQVIKLGKEVLRLNPHDHEVLYVLSEIYYNEKNLGAARNFAERAVNANKNYIRAYYLLGMTYYLEENNDLYYEKIIDIFHKILNLNIDNLDLAYQTNLYAKLGEIYWELDDLDQCIKYHKKSAEIETDEYRKKFYYSAYLFELNHSLAFTRKDVFLAHTKYNELFQHITPYEHKNLERKAKLRIGYLSPDFCMHPVTYFTMQLLLQYNKEEFEVYCYSNTLKPDEVTEVLKPLVTKWRDIVDKQYEENARLIYEDKIDILVDFAGHTSNNNLTVLAYKPAPIQISGIGYVNTTGLNTVDYFITDHYCDPEGLNDPYFSEKLLRLPYTHFCYKHIGVEYPCREAPFQKNGHITFGSFNKFKKVTAETLALWAKILERVPNSKIIIKVKACTNRYGEKFARERLLKAGIKENQFELRGLSSNYMDEYNEIDIALDTYPCAGGTTTFEALYMGVPVITLVGESHVSRFGYSILKNLEFEEGIAYHGDEYVEKAVILANDKNKIRELHKTLRERLLNSPLMNGKQYVADMENAYKKIWDEAIDMKFKKNNKFNNNSKQDKHNNSKNFDMNKINALQQEVLGYKLKEKYEEALISIGEIFSMEYYSDEIMSEVAEIYYLKGDMERAESWSKKIISLNTKTMKGYLILAQIYSKQSRIAELLPVLEQLLGADFAGIENKIEKLLETVNLSAYEDEIEKNYRNIHQYLCKKQTVEKKQPAVGAALNNLKNLLQELGIEKKQEDTLAELISNAFEHGLTEAAAEKLKDEDVEQVIAEMMKHTGNNQQKVELLNLLAAKFYEYHCTEKVLPLLVKALELDGQDDNSLKNLSVVLFSIGEKELALQYANKVVKKDIAMIELMNRIKG